VGKDALTERAVWQLVREYAQQIGIGELVHELYFNPQHDEFQPRTMWSLSNAFTSAFKELDPIPQFRATAKLGSFLEATTPA